MLQNTHTIRVCSPLDHNAFSAAPGGAQSCKVELHYGETSGCIVLLRFVMHFVDVWIVVRKRLAC